MDWRSKVTHPVKTRQSKVQIRMRTWLNMAELVLWMALWKSFCGGRRNLLELLRKVFCWCRETS